MRKYRPISEYELDRKLSWPRLLLAAGLFLFGLLYQPSTVHAQITNEFTAATEVNVLDNRNEKLHELDKEFEVKKDKIDDKIQEIEKAQTEVKVVQTSVRKLENKVDNIRNEVKNLKAKLAEKHRREAMRIFTIGQYANDAAGNLYEGGNCTWYVKSRRPDLSNSLGNANTWYSMAQSMGYRVGTMAKTGSIGTTTRGLLGHVVYVEKWLGNGRILISEMNVNGLWSVDTREADESEFVYIYAL